MISLYKKVLFIVLFILFSIVIFWYLSPRKVKADSFSLYSTKCYGGFKNADNAIGPPDVLKYKVSDFNVINSAYLSGSNQAEIVCSNFDGEILDNVVPKSITLKFSWALTYNGDLNMGVSKLEDQKESNPESLESSSTQALDNNISASSSVEENIPAISDSPNDIILSNTQENSEPSKVNDEKNIVSFLGNFIKIAFAEESTTSIDMNTQEQNLDLSLSSDILDSPSTTPSEYIDANIVLDSDSSTNSSSSSSSIQDIGASSTLSSNNENDPHGVVEVLYSYNGSDLKSLGYVESDEFENAKFEIPLPENNSWDSISKLQIYVKSVPAIDGVSPTIYVDSVILDVDFDYLNSDNHPYPTKDRGDEFIGSINYENYSAFLVKRPIFTKRLINQFSSSTDNSLLSSTTPNIFKTKSELWISDNNSTTTDKWMFVSDDKITEDTKVFFRYGKLFWLDGTSTVWIFNPKAQSYDSVSIESDGPTRYIFDDEAGGKNVMLISQPGNIVAFEEYIEPQK